MTIDFQKVADAIEKAPEEIKNLMFSVELGEKLSKIAEANKLEEDMYLQMVDEVGYVILGLKNNFDFFDSLIKIGMVKDLVTPITKELNRTVFSKLNNIKIGGVEKTQTIDTETGQQTQTNISFSENNNIAKRVRQIIRDKNQNDLPVELKNIPQPKQEVILGGIWEEKVDEIAKKYSLNETQTDSLINNVLFILINTKKLDNFLETIVVELNISRLLAEQITEDLKVRVFEYVIKSIEKRDEITSKSKPPLSNSVVLPTPVSHQRVTPTDLQIPEIRPNITPMIEPGEKAHTTQPFSQTSPVETSKQNASPVYIPKTERSTPIKNSEIIQKPISVPRYTGEVIEEKISNFQFPISNKNPNEPQTTREPVAPPVKRYAVDPYREPIE